jgi:hypothetical protein
MRHSILAIVAASFFAAALAVTAKAANPSPAASNVTAAVTTGNLVVTGSSKADDIELSQVSGGKWTVAGHNGTTINGQPSITTTAVTGSIDINLNKGNDHLSVHDGDIPGHLTIDGSKGDDATDLSALTVGTAFHFTGGTGNDSLAVNTLAVSDPSDASFSTIDGGSGNDSLQVFSFSDQNLEVTLGSGNDTLQMGDAQLLGSASRRLVVDAGTQNDNVSLTDVHTGPLTVTMGAGDDSLTIQESSANTATLDGGKGSDALSEHQNTWGSVTRTSF